MPNDSDDVRAQAESSSLDLLNTVSVNVPAFWPKSAEAWFIQVEAQFALKGVMASSTKFYYCVSSFNQETANQVLDLIKSPPTTDPYGALKNRLLKLFALDDFLRYEAISNLPLSGDMKPSKLMSNMLALFPVGHEPCFFLKGAFLKRLPANIRAHLLRDDFSDPISFALKADEIYQSRVSSSHVYAVSSTPEDQQSINAVKSSVPNRPCRSATPHASSRQDSRSQSPYHVLLSSFLGFQGQEMQSSMFLVGKLVHRQEDIRTLPADPATSSPLVYLQDSLSSWRFLIDSGASLSVFPAPRSSSTYSGVKLLTADGSSLTCSGSRIIPL